jgi:general stress protein 26
MARWEEVVAEAPALAAAAEERFAAHRHAVVATIRADGSPRVSGIETTFADGELWLGMMPDSRKGADLRRDARFALHSGSDDPDDADPSAWAGDAKVAGRAELVTDPSSIERFVGHQQQTPPGPFDLFRADVSELTVIRVGTPADHLVIETWREGAGVRRVERR